MSPSKQFTAVFSAAAVVAVSIPSAGAQGAPALARPASSTADVAPAAPAPKRSSLDSLAAVGVARNLSRRIHEYSLDVARTGVSQARGLYFPSASFNARYTRVQGNTVNLGTLINPAFGALNQLLQRPAFPTDLDLQLPLRQETTLRLTQPIFQPAIVQANRIAGAAADAEQAGHDAFLRQLDADIRLSYLTYAKARSVVAIYESSLQLAAEHLRVAERLLAAGSVTPDVVQRARAERSAVAQQLEDARQRADAARFALNVILNAPLDADVPLFSDSELQTAPLPDLKRANDAAIAGREELRAVDHAKRIATARTRLAQGSYLPNVSMAFDYGVQGRDYQFDRSRDYTALTVLVSWNVFNGGQDAARVQAASLDARRTEIERQVLERAIALQVATAWNAARVAEQAVTTAGERLDAARRAFDVVRRRIEQGSATQLEYLDGQTALTAARLNETVTRYEAFARKIELDRVAALSPLPTSIERR